MVKTLLLLTILAACGKQVEISTKKLEFNSSLSDGIEKTADQKGMLKRGWPDTLTVNGSSYPVSIYSSHQALEFIAARPLTDQLEVKFKGDIKEAQIVLQVVQKP